jgi:hypothetical protein
VNLCALQVHCQRQGGACVVLKQKHLTMHTSDIHRARSAHARPRPRRGISSREARGLRLVGFRYSASRDAYVLRIVGNRFGPVYQVRQRNS